MTLAIYIVCGLALAYAVIGLACSAYDRVTEPPGFVYTPLSSVTQFLIVAALWPAWLAEALSIRM